MKHWRERLYIVMIMCDVSKFAAFLGCLRNPKCMPYPALLSYSNRFYCASDFLNALS